MNNTSLLIAASALAVACATRPEAKTAEPPDAMPGKAAQLPVPVERENYKLSGRQRPKTNRPLAVVYRTSVDCRNLVPVQLSADGKLIKSYPDPADVRHLPVPVSLADGWLLDRRGIGPNTAFLDYTYERYAALPQAPSHEELLRHIAHPGAVSEMYALPITLNAALADTALCNSYIARHFSDCKQLK